MSFFNFQWTDDDFDDDDTSTVAIPSLGEVGTSLYGRMVVPVLVQVRLHSVLKALNSRVCGMLIGFHKRLKHNKTGP